LPFRITQVGRSLVGQVAAVGLPIPLPPLEGQKRIVAVLDQAFAALDRARADAESNLADAEALYQATIEELFSGRSAWPGEDLTARVRFVDYRGNQNKLT
jgi:type I restriction enzyme, S subunit